MTFRELRKSRGLTTKYVAEKLGIKTTTLTRKERNNSFNTLQVKTLCDLYGVNVEEVDI